VAQLGGVVAQYGRRGGSIWEAWWLNMGDVVAQLGGAVAQSGRHGGSSGGMMAQKEPESPQPTADCQSPGGLPPGTALGCRLTSVRGNRGENYENKTLVGQKHIKKK
jgi:hypothetical protein